MSTASPTPSLGSLLWRHRFIFLISFIAVFVLSFAVLSFIGLVPEELSNGSDTNLVSFVNAESESNSGVTIIKNEPQGEGEAPVRLVIDKIGVNSPVQNPDTRDVTALDQYLTKGVVHYPGSGNLGQGNMFIFGHSSTLPVIHNQAYKALNHLDYLAAGDLIKVYSATKVYTYQVTSVTKKDEGQAVIDLAEKDNKITISTCDTFSGIKQQRIIAVGDFVSSEPL